MSPMQRSTHAAAEEVAIRPNPGFRTAIDQARLVQSGEVSARELVAASLDAIERLNPRLNAFVTVCAERAIDEATAIEPGDRRPLAGVPVAIKDSVALTAAVRTTQGSAALEEWTPEHDSAFVRRLRAAGAVIVGKTNTPELALKAVTEPRRYGATRNPWDPSRTPGGSSGGSAAAVASGMVALGHGGDVGGSIRIPASCCGLVGLKPSRGRVSLGPDLSEIAAGLFTEGVLTRTVADTALSLDLIAGYEPGDPYSAAPPPAPFLQMASRPPPRLRIAVATRPPNQAAVHPHHLEAVERTAALLQAAGHRVVEAEPAWDDKTYPAHMTTLWAALVQDEVHTWGRLRGRPLDRDHLEPETREWLERGRRVSAADYLQAVDALRRLGRRIVAFWTDHEVLLTPTVTQPPPRIGSLDADEQSRWIPFLSYWNITGQPAISLPVHHAEGLPVGVQLVGPPGGDGLLLQLAAQLEAAAAWSQRRPQVSPAGQS